MPDAPNCISTDAASADVSSTELVHKLVGSGHPVPQLPLLQGLLRRARLLPRNQQRLTVLDGCSGVLRSGRLTLLLGPPASGKTTLLKALAGKLGGGALEVSLSARSNVRCAHKLTPLAAASAIYGEPTGCCGNEAVGSVGSG